jgi:hypothetical protein
MAVDSLMAPRESATKAYQRLLQELAAWQGRSLEPGDDRRGVIVTGELEVELSVRVRRRVLPETAQDYRAAALKRLEEKPYLVRHCGCHVMAKSSWGGRRQRDCKGRVTAVVVYRPAGSPSGVEFVFVCSKHREAHGVDATRVLGLVELPPPALADTIRRADAQQAQRDAEYRVEQEQREREYREQRARAVAAAAPPPGRRVRHLISIAKTPASKPDSPAKTGK